MLVENLVRKEGAFNYEWKWTGSRQDYITALRDFSPDIVLSDHSMPGFSSVEAFRMLREFDLDIPFIMVTATVSEDFAVMMMKEGVADYVLKDRPQRLPHAIENTIEKWEAERKNRAFIGRLIKSEANLVALMDHSNANIYSLDTSFRFVALNGQFKETVKLVYGSDIGIGDSVMDLVDQLDEEQARGWRETYTQAMEGMPLHFVKEFELHGTRLFIRFHVNPIIEDNSVTGVACFAIDITNEKLAEENLARSQSDLVQRNKDLEQFAYIVSHNLRGPVANILGISHVLQQQGTAERDRAEAFDGIFVATSRLDEVIRDLNRILDTKQEVNNRKEVAVFQEIVDSIVVGIERIIRQNHVTIVTDFTAVNSILTIRSFLQSIFYNLISNSIKYKQPDVDMVITITSFKHGDGVKLVFTDNGMGIDLSRQGSKVFGLYKRFHPKHAEGKGMGLFMVKTQVESLGGEISIKSEVDKGTEFTIEL